MSEEHEGYLTQTAILAAHLSPITDVWIEDVGKYAPHDDITPYEVALLLPLFMFCAAGVIGAGRFGYAEYIARHNLRRHFAS